MTVPSLFCPLILRTVRVLFAIKSVICYEVWVLSFIPIYSHIAPVEKA